VKSASIGGLSLGKTSNATNGFDALTTANTSIVAQPLSVQPLGNAQLGGLDLPFDGSFRNVVRYDTPVWAGFIASASWGASGLDSSGETGNMWDVALRYIGEQGGFKLVGGLGYRVDDGQEISVKVAGLNLVLPTGAETKTFLAAGSVMHIATGLFLTANYADQDWDVGAPSDINLSMWQLQGGIETKLFAVGKSTFYAEYSELDTDLLADKSELWGLGFVQAVDAAAMDLYIGYRSYSIVDEDVGVLQAGARIKF
jgi:predicted porin